MCFEIRYSEIASGTTIVTSIVMVTMNSTRSVVMANEIRCSSGRSEPPVKIEHLESERKKFQ